MISVVIPTYGGAQYLSRAIDSALAQKNVELEVIVVDDNDPNSKGRKETEQVLQKYIDCPRVIYIKHPKNLNGSCARNSGIKASKGEYISFLDDDDLYLPLRLSKCINCAKETNADIIYTDVLIAENNIPSAYIEATGRGNLFEALWTDENLLGTGSNIFIKKAAIESNGDFNETLPRQQDFDFLLRQFSKGAIAYGIKECLVIKAMNNTNNSVDYKTLKDIKERLLDAYKECIEVLDKEEQCKIYISQHKELLHAAALANDTKGIREQKDVLRRYGYNMDLMEIIKHCVLKSKTQIVAQKLFWTYKSTRLKKQYPYVKELVKML